MNDTIFNTQDIVTVGPETLSDLKRLAEQSPRRRSRLCLHHSTSDEVHEMVIVFCGDTYLRPHRHPRGKTESYHVIEGELTVLFFDDNGQITRQIEMGAVGSGKVVLYRLATDAWHMPVARSRFLVYHETFRGPFVKEQDVEYAPWSPCETDVDGIAAFRKRVLGDQR
jgi:cupin fold WbuC family metalloprotein